MKVILIIIHLNAGGFFHEAQGGRVMDMRVCEGRAEGYRMQSGGRWLAYCAPASYGGVAYAPWAD